VKVNFVISYEKPLYFFIIALLCRYLSFSHLHRKEKGKGEEEDGAKLPLFGRMVGAMSVIVRILS